MKLLQNEDKLCLVSTEIRATSAVTPNSGPILSENCPQFLN